ncbi:quinone oxidoreductase family protein [Streptomyces odontomachi]|uniref:quinone oxidoreductase family protein n=1 Tax=Streptomyces odontomachi TaxID=2944940 RepID=UPI0021097BD2|nr:zinc-binding dehydrogenase [Streptomyces sp. ODS25]
MRRVRYHAYGGPEVLTVEEAEVPSPGPGQVLLRTEVIGANFVDTLIRSGRPEGSPYHRPLPGTLTGDVLGTVESVGEGADPALAGRRVAALVAVDAFADYAVADADWLSPVPDGLDAAAATSLPLIGPVALGALRMGRPEPGATVLVHAAAGAIGHLAVQLAKLRGAGKVIATAGSPAKLDFARAHGADVAVDYTDPDWPAQVRKAAPDGVDIVLDGVGGDTTRQSLDLLAPFGRAVVFGSAKGEMFDVPIWGVLGLRSVAGFGLLAFRTARPDLARQDVQDVTEYAVSGRLRTAVHARVPLAEAATAHRMFEDRTQAGRILLVP